MDADGESADEAGFFARYLQDAPFSSEGGEDAALSVQVEAYRKCGVVTNPMMFSTDYYDIKSRRWSRTGCVLFDKWDALEKYQSFTKVLQCLPCDLSFSDFAFRVVKEKSFLCFHVADKRVDLRIAKNVGHCFTVDLSSIDKNEEASQTIVRIREIIKDSLRIQGDQHQEPFFVSMAKLVGCARLNGDEEMREEQFKRKIRALFAKLSAYDCFNNIVKGLLKEFVFRGVIEESGDVEKPIWALQIVTLFFALYPEVGAYVFVPANGVSNAGDYAIENSSGGSFFWVRRNQLEAFNPSEKAIVSVRILESIRGLQRTAVDWSIKQNRRIRLQSTKSAIGSIMSRNGSHNIGSHVLAALSHNVGTMPDDRVLYQYIQHRMDYIATATTDMPKWCLPTMFVSGVMKEFLRQKHLLDYISGSEGLHAYKFQGQAVDKNQPNTIRLHVRRITSLIEEWERQGFWSGKDVVDFVHYSPNNGVDFSQDVAVAIPGGTVGQHAFYTIIENVLRNAAKHEWAESVRVWNLAKTVLKEDVCNRQKELNPHWDAVNGYDELFDREFGWCRPVALNIYVDFKDNPNTGRVECRVWNERVVSVANTSKIRTEIVCCFCKRKDLDGLAGVAKVLFAWHRILQRREDCINEKDKSKIQGNALHGLIQKSVLLHTLDAKSSRENHEANDREICREIAEGLCGFAAEKGKSAISEYLEVAIREASRELADRIGDKIGQSFIEETGGLRKENWGIAEMRISAGFLQRRDIKHIGGLPGAESPLTIIKPVLVVDERSDECLGYRFDLEKPKLLLVVFADRDCAEKDDGANIDWERINRRAARCGVAFISEKDIKDDNTYPYSYILFERLAPRLVKKLKTREVALPFRNLCWRRTYDGIEHDDILKRFIPSYEGDLFEREVLRDTIRRMELSQAMADSVCQKLLKSVYAQWLRFVQSRGLKCGRDGVEIALSIYDQGGSGGSAQTLITKADLLRFVFENSFNAAIRSFLQENGPKAGTGSLLYRVERDGKECFERRIEPMSPRVAAVLFAVAEMSNRRIGTWNELAKSAGMDERNFVRNPNFVKKAISAQLNLWLRHDDVLGGRDTVRLKCCQDSDWLSVEEFRSANGLIHVGTWDSLSRDPACRYWLSRFVRYVATVVLDQADSFLRKYEERFATLPESFASRPDRGELKWIWRIGNEDVQVLIAGNEKQRNQYFRDGAICYFRHGNNPRDGVTDYYYEALSGAQSTLNSFVALQRDIACVQAPNADEQSRAEADCRVAGFSVQLVENAAFRVLIIDERVMKFMDRHPKVRDALSGMRMVVADDSTPGVAKMFSPTLEKDETEFGGIKLTDFEIVIIHQGVIDKLLFGHEDKKVVERWLDGMISRLHYVVITTGRGSPSNIPDSARVLPYSVIESSILQRYPEKMILVDAVMNILPVKSERRSI